MRARRFALGLLLLAPLVRAAGPAQPAASAPRVPASGKAAPSVTSRGFTTWIWPAPRRGGERSRLGYVRVGTSLALRDEAPVRGPGCAADFVPVVPEGWVCLDRTASVDADSRYAAAMRDAAPRDALLPFFYALSNGAPMYRRLPSEREWQRAERGLGPAGSFAPQAWGNRGHEQLAEVRAASVDSDVPAFFADGGSAGEAHPHGLVRRTIPHGSMLAYTRAFTHEGRTFLLSSDGTAVPADRVRPFRESTFAGVRVPGEATLPLAWLRTRPRPRWALSSDGTWQEAGAWPARAFARLDPATPARRDGARTLLSTLERDAAGRSLWVDERDATVVRAKDRPPIGVAAGARWLDVSITQGTLVAYDGSSPVFATLISPGVGGVPVKGRDPVKASTTPIGVYRITFKHVASTMSPEFGEDRSFWIADVPYTQYFAAPFALHTAYWHESFGDPMSAGCINLSPRDGKWLFDWTTPRVPSGWGGAQANGAGTYVSITR